MDKSNRAWVIAVSFLIAFMLTAIPLPEWALPWRPAWIAMVLFYWCMALPERVGVLIGWSIGLVLDVMHGSILGQHAFGLAFVAYITVQYHQRIRVFPLTQQALFVASTIFLYLVMMLWIYNLLGSVSYGPKYLFATLTTALLWPWLFIVLRDVRRRARVA
ncbi:MAG: rod shape-determining protein MreD [Gammaproteobacteria bacterium]|nr:rod shape-determining protein MreD [Gammaproteobacteria bacterium]MCZ6770453.1 rod shape-determining protein MreD [Pseudomonadota bacterium]MCZ6893589.1 rod shape-determining protein MreD [Gammaproteobacteria bacterium]